MDFQKQEDVQVQKIIGKKVFNGKTLYLVKWKDYPIDEATWECNKLLNNAKDKIREFKYSNKETEYFPDIKIEDELLNTQVRDTFKRKRGRPPKLTFNSYRLGIQKQKSKQSIAEQNQNDFPRRRRGRPRGSKNKKSNNVRQSQSDSIEDESSEGESKKSLQGLLQSSRSSNSLEKTYNMGSKKNKKIDKRINKLKRIKDQGFDIVQDIIDTSEEDMKLKICKQTKQRVFQSEQQIDEQWNEKQMQKIVKKNKFEDVQKDQSWVSQYQIENNMKQRQLVQKQIKEFGNVHNVNNVNNIDNLDNGKQNKVLLKKSLKCTLQIEDDSDDKEQYKDGQEINISLSSQNDQSEGIINKQRIKKTDNINKNQTDNINKNQTDNINKAQADNINKNQALINSFAKNKNKLNNKDKLDNKNSLQNINNLQIQKYNTNQKRQSHNILYNEINIYKEKVQSTNIQFNHLPKTNSILQKTINQKLYPINPNLQKNNQGFNPKYKGLQKINTGLQKINQCLQKVNQCLQSTNKENKINIQPNIKLKPNKYSEVQISQQIDKSYIKIKQSLKQLLINQQNKKISQQTIVQSTTIKQPIIKPNNIKSSINKQFIQQSSIKQQIKKNIRSQQIININTKQYNKITKIYFLQTIQIQLYSSNINSISLSKSIIQQISPSHIITKNNTNNLSTFNIPKLIHQNKITHTSQTDKAKYVLKLLYKCIKQQKQQETIQLLQRFIQVYQSDKNNKLNQDQIQKLQTIVQENIYLVQFNEAKIIKKLSASQISLYVIADFIKGVSKSIQFQQLYPLIHNYCFYVKFLQDQTIKNKTKYQPIIKIQKSTHKNLKLQQQNLLTNQQLKQILIQTIKDKKNKQIYSQLLKTTQQNTLLSKNQPNNQLNQQNKSTNNCLLTKSNIKQEDINTQDQNNHN